MVNQFAVKGHRHDMVQECLANLTLFKYALLQLCLHVLPGTVQCFLQL